jgi:hypothetical protein
MGDEKPSGFEAAVAPVMARREGRGRAHRAAARRGVFSDCSKRCLGRSGRYENEGGSSTYERLAALHEQQGNVDQARHYLPQLIEL